MSDIKKEIHSRLDSIDRKAESYESDLSAAQQKIAELEERVADAEADAVRLVREKMDRVTELIAERQRRGSTEARVNVLEQIVNLGMYERTKQELVKAEERYESAEAALRSVYMNAPVPCRQKARAHFTRYPTASDSEERGG